MYLHVLTCTHVGSELYGNNLHMHRNFRLLYYALFLKSIDLHNMEATITDIHKNLARLQEQEVRNKVKYSRSKEDRAMPIVPTDFLLMYHNWLKSS